MENKIDVSKITDYEIAILLIDRNNCLSKANEINELLGRIGEVRGFNENQDSNTSKPAVVVQELNFSTLKFEAQQGAKLGEFEIAHKANNLDDKWSTAYNILRNSNATIKDRYHGETYQYSYWLYGEDKIYRQKLKPKTPKT
jgi:hypothetical protein